MKTYLITRNNTVVARYCCGGRLPEHVSRDNAEKMIDDLCGGDESTELWLFDGDYRPETGDGVPTTACLVA